MLAFAVSLSACSGIVGDTPVETSGDDRETTSTANTDNSAPSRNCVDYAGATAPVDTGTPETDALFLAGEIFLCADDVVVVESTDLNEVAVAAQLAAAVQGPLLYDHPQVAAEVGRLKPLRVHLVGGAQILTPPTADVIAHDLNGAVDHAMDALGVTKEVALPSVPDSTTVVETVGAINGRDRVVRPRAVVTSTTITPPAPEIDPGETIKGIADSASSEAVWMVDASDPLIILLSAADGSAVGATTLAVDGENLLGHPEVAPVLAGHSANTIRFVGGHSGTDDWELAVLTNGQQVPGGGFHILPPDRPRRYVAFYGHPETSALGVLGEQRGEETIERMQPFLEAYEGDGAQTVPTFEIIATVAAASAGADENYSYEWPIETFDDLVQTAERHDAYIVLDLQPGRSDFLTQAKKYEELLLLPNVGLAIDPEWRLEPDQVHLKQVGRVHSSEINEVINWLGDLVRENGLPQKMLVLHMFRTFMIQDREILLDRPELQVVIQMDGDGTEPQKDNTWAALQQGFEDAFWSWGWKNFFDEDEPGPPTPESTMSKRPSPVYVSYQ